MQRRFVELDSLRGIAALTVVANHFLLPIPAVYSAVAPVLDPAIPREPTALWPIAFTPLHIFWSGAEGVTFFFILSGFVLSLPFHAGRPVQYDAFLIRRVCRIYLPYLAAVGAAIGMYTLFSRNGMKGVSPWFNWTWIVHPDPTVVVGHLTLIGDFRNWLFNPVIWSLVYEMRISIVFPLLVFFVVRYDWKSVVFGAAALSLVAPFLGTHEPSRTVEYIPMFALGALLARHRAWLITTYRRLTWSAKLALLLLATTSYTFRWWFFPHSLLVHPLVGLSHARVVDDWATTLGAATFIAVAISSSRASAMLHHPLLVLYGKMSYSVYLYHAIVLYSFMYLLYPAVPIVAIWAIAFVAMSGMAYVSYRAVELPAIGLGHRLAARLLSSKGDQQPLAREAV